MRLLALELTSDLNSIALTGAVLSSVGRHGVAASGPPPSHRDGLQKTNSPAVGRHGVAVSEAANSTIITDTWETAHLRRQQAFTRTIDLLGHHETTIEQLDGIAVDIGPGSYFGLRVAYTYAQGLAFPHRIPVTGATSCEIMAWCWFASGKATPFVALHDIRRGHLAVAVFQSANQLLSQTDPDIRIISHHELSSAIPAGATVGTPDWGRLSPALGALSQASFEIIEGTTYPTAAALAQLVEERIKQGQPMRPVSPLYLHPPVAEIASRAVSS